MAILLYSSKNIASYNIAKHVREYFGGDRYKDNLLIDTKAESIIGFDPYDFIPKDRLDWRKNLEYIVVLSSHKSKTEIPTLTVHCPGEIEKAFSIAFGTKMFIILKEMYKRADIAVSYEADHHKPSIDYPILYAELGSNEKYWKNEKYGRIVAEAVIEALESKEIREAYLGIGGNHYMTKQTKLAIEKDYVFTHLIPKHKGEVLERFDELLEKNVEKIERVVLDKKGLRKEHKDILYKKTEEFGLDLIKI